MGEHRDDDPSGRSPHRDDHEAALQRADALQRELDAERAKGTKSEARIATLETQLAEARDTLKNLGVNQHSSVPADSHGAAASMSLHAGELQYPDDGPVSRAIRTIDRYVGHIELAILLALFVSVVVVASLSAVSEHVFHHHIGLWWTWVVRKGTFAIAMFGAAYATQQQRLLAMDLVSRSLSPRLRLALGIAIRLFTFALAGVLVYIGLYMHDHADHHAGPKLDLTLFVLTEKDALAVIPIGGALIALHCLLHALIEADYLKRGKRLPEPARTGH